MPAWRCCHYEVGASAEAGRAAHCGGYRAGARARWPHLAGVHHGERQTLRGDCRAQRVRAVAHGEERVMKMEFGNTEVAVQDIVRLTTLAGPIGEDDKDPDAIFLRFERETYTRAE